MPKTIDPQVHELAAYFLEEWRQVSRKAHDKRVTELAQTIQGAIEDWMEEESEENPRQRGDDDGREYSDPGDRMRGLE